PPPHVRACTACVCCDASDHHRDLPSSPTRRSSDLRSAASTGSSSRICRTPHRSSRRPPPPAGGSPSRTGRAPRRRPEARSARSRSEEHTSELQSRFDLVCRLLLEKKKSSTYWTHQT